MDIIIDYFNDSYMTLMLIAGLIVILAANRKTKIKGIQYVWAVIGIVFTLTVLEALENWCDTYHKSIRILYFKTTLVYTLYPLMALIEIYLIVSVKRKLLMAVPQFIVMMVSILDLFDTGFIYRFNPDHHFQGGWVWPLPHLVLGLYVVVLTVMSIHFLSRRSKSKGIIVLFMAVSALVTDLGQYYDFAEGYAESVAVLDIMVYYFYLAAIYHSEVQAKLAQSELTLMKEKMEAEEIKTSLLLGQMKPHFVQNCLVTIRNLCRKDSKAAVEAINHFSRYLRRSMTVMDTTHPILFETEMELVENYLYMEQLRFGSDVKVEMDIRAGGFNIPALTVEPIVENAVRHGIRGEIGSGTVRISTDENGEEYLITVEDNGAGFDTSLLDGGSGEHIGLKNVENRLMLMMGGRLEIVSRIGEGTRVTLHIPKSPKTFIGGAQQ